MKPGRLRLVLLLLVLTGLAGCSTDGGTTSRAAVETHVRADGEAERRVAVAAVKPGPSLDLSRRWSLEAGVDVADRSAAAGRSYELSRDGTGGLSLAEEDYFFWRELEFSDRLEGPLAGGRRLPGGAVYKLVMPGRISIAPGAARTAGGVAIYDVDADENPAVRAESRVVRWWAVVGTTGVLLAVAALILGGRAAGFVRGIPRWLWTGEWS